MEYNKIVAITGLNGLFELLSSKTDGAIVRSLDDNTTKFVASRIHNFSHLESIEVFTVKENTNLVDIFKSMEQSNEDVPDTKNNASVKKYFQSVYPDLDFDRVYTSDMKKMIKWFDILRNKVEFKISESPGKEVVKIEENAGEAVEGQTVENTGGDTSLQPRDL
ncbi:MAG: DUF5606 domain-containing protein [Chitinophagaceae bacterium]